MYLQKRILKFSLKVSLTYLKQILEDTQRNFMAQLHTPLQEEF